MLAHVSFGLLEFLSIFLSLDIWCSDRMFSEWPHRASRWHLEPPVVLASLSFPFLTVLFSAHERRETVSCLVERVKFQFHPQNTLMVIAVWMHHRFNHEREWLRFFLFKWIIQYNRMYFEISKSLAILLQLHTERTFCAFLPAVFISLTWAMRMLIIAPCSFVNRLKNFSKKSHFFLDDSYLSKLERMYIIFGCVWSPAFSV